MQAHFSRLFTAMQAFRNAVALVEMGKRKYNLAEPQMLNGILLVKQEIPKIEPAQLARELGRQATALESQARNYAVSALRVAQNGLTSFEVQKNTKRQQELRDQQLQRVQKEKQQQQKQQGVQGQGGGSRRLLATGEPLTSRFEPRKSRTVSPRRTQLATRAAVDTSPPSTGLRGSSSSNRPPRGIPTGGNGAAISSNGSATRFAPGAPLKRPLERPRDRVFEEDPAEEAAAARRAIGAPLYDAQGLAKFYSKRPLEVVGRALRVTTALGSVAASVLIDRQRGQLDANMPRRASQLRRALTSLGPTFVKLGQALSTRPDLCPPAYLDELALLQDALPTFPDAEAFACIEGELGRPMESMFESISPSPIAAASLGQSISPSPIAAASLGQVSPQTSQLVELALLALLQDALPTFPDEEAFACIEGELGRPMGTMFESISPSQIAAASLGQLYVGLRRFSLSCPIPSLPSPSSLSPLFPPGQQGMADQIRHRISSQGAMPGHHNSHRAPSPSPSSSACSLLDSPACRCTSGSGTEVYKARLSWSGMEVGVYKARLIGGTEVAVKVQRPGITTAIGLDFLLIRGLDPVGITTAIGLDFLLIRGLCSLVDRYVDSLTTSVTIGLDFLLIRGLCSLVDKYVDSLTTSITTAIGLDFLLIRGLCSLVDKYVGSLTTSSVALLDEFADRVYQELNYVQEARNARRFRQLYGNQNGVYVPQIVWRHTSCRVLCMEWVDGVKLSDAGCMCLHTFMPCVHLGPTPHPSPLPTQIVWRNTSCRVLCMEWVDGVKLSDAASMRQNNLDVIDLVDIGIQCSLRQLLEFGYFHADPHPGNLLAMSDGRLAFLDFGMMSETPPRARFAIIGHVVHLVNRDYEAMARDYYVPLPLTVASSHPFPVAVCLPSPPSRLSLRSPLSGFPSSPSLPSTPRELDFLDPSVDVAPIMPSSPLHLAPPFSPLTPSPCPFSPLSRLSLRSPPELDFLDPSVDVAPIVPALRGFFDDVLQATVSELNFKTIVDGLGAVLYQYPFNVPAYYALILRSLTVLEGLALYSDPNFKVLAAAYPYMAKRLLTDPNPYLRDALIELLFKDGVFRWSRLENLLTQGQRDRDYKTTDALQPLMALILGPEGKPLRALVVAEGVRVAEALLVAGAVDGALEVLPDAVTTALLPRPLVPLRQALEAARGGGRGCGWEWECGRECGGGEGSGKGGCEGEEYGGDGGVESSGAAVLGVAEDFGWVLRCWALLRTSDGFDPASLLPLVDEEVREVGPVSELRDIQNPSQPIATPLLSLCHPTGVATGGGEGDGIGLCYSLAAETGSTLATAAATTSAVLPGPCTCTSSVGLSTNQASD
ncbi:unnamed protein product [Closterium sp. NIES-64]|nr:unnamed protein product [Closterium sp. NIES-64]